MIARQDAIKLKLQLVVSEFPLFKQSNFYRYLL